MKKKQQRFSMAGAVTPPPAQDSSCTPASQKTIRNPYAKKQPQPAASTTSPPPSVDSGDDARICEAPSNREATLSEPSSELPLLATPVQCGFTGFMPHLLPLEPNTFDGSYDFQSLVAPQSSQPFTLGSILKGIQDNPIVAFGDVPVSELTKNSPRYEKEKLHLEHAFFAAIASHPVAKSLADMQRDPENPSTSIRKLYAFCGGRPTPTKKKLLNWCLLLFSSGLYLKNSGKIDASMDPKLFAEAQYEPNSVQKKFKILFSSFRGHGINFSFSKDFNEPGEYFYVIFSC